MFEWAVRQRGEGRGRVLASQELAAEMHTSHVEYPVVLIEFLVGRLG
jgi:hypothetical protein